MDELVQIADTLGDAAETTAGENAKRLRSELELSSKNAATRAVHESVLAAAEARAVQVRDLAANIAPGLASVDLNSAEWSTDKLIGAGISHQVRIGELGGNPASGQIPVVLPLLGRPGWYVRADDESVAHRMIQNVVLRLVGAAPAFRLRVDTYDPSLSGSMGLLGRVSSAQPQVVALARHAPDDLRALLAELRTVSSHRASRLAQLGKSRFEDMLDDDAHMTDSYRLIVLLDYPTGIDAKLQQELTLLAAHGGDRGVGFLVHHGGGRALDNDVDPSELAELLDPVRLQGSQALVDTLPNLWINLDPGVDPQVAAEVSEAIVDATTSAELPTVDFATTLPEREAWWQPASDELSAVVGLDGRTPARVRLRSGNPALPHALIGGAVGQGKSNLLLVLVHGLAVRYAPRDLEMYLLDFKHGVEFAGLGPTDPAPYWLPHLRVLGVHSDIAFGIAVLAHLVEELERRSELFKTGNVTDIADFPAADQARPPRILIVLDEFQVLFEDETTADDAARMIEKLVRLGRAYGIHMVLSTQTIDGMQRLATRRDSILGQVPYRIALKSTQADSQALLRTGNTAAAELRFRGEAILNANFGAPDDNNRIVVAHAERASLSRLRETLWTMDDQPRPPRIFHRSESASLTGALGTSTDMATGQVEAWAGMPISVAETAASVPVRGEPGAGVIVLGDGPTDALGVLTGLAVSAAMTGESPSIVVLDGIQDGPGVDDAKRAFGAALEGLGCSVELVPEERAAERLAGLRTEITANDIATPTYLVGLGMHGIANLTARGVDGIRRPVDDLQTIVRDGPAHNVFTFAWWNRLHVCTAHLGFDRCNISTYLFLRHPQDGVRTVCGPLVRWASEPHRALLFDSMGSEPQVVVPFAPLTEDDVSPLLTNAMARVRR